MSNPRITAALPQNYREEFDRNEAPEYFKAENIQFMGKDHLLSMQTIAGHGRQWGMWETSIDLHPAASKHQLEIDIQRRIIHLLSKIAASTNDTQSATGRSANSSTEAASQALIDEGVQTVIRLALITKLTATGIKGYAPKVKLKASTIAQLVYQRWPRIVALAIRRKSAIKCIDPGLFRHLTNSDIAELQGEKKNRIELERLDKLSSLGLWHDAPIKPNLPKITNPRQKPNSSQHRNASEPHPHLPDEWLSEIGPRITWVIKELAPPLLRFIEGLPNLFKDVDWSRAGVRLVTAGLIKGALNRDPWMDHAGRPLAPPFPLATGSNRGGRGANTLEWPPRTYDQIVKLSLTLQSAHLFITLLATAGRISEVITLKANCVQTYHDGHDSLRGFTYKLAENIFGEERRWPAPELLKQSLGQQARLALAWGLMPGALNRGGFPNAPRFGSTLWISLGGSGKTGENCRLHVEGALQLLAERLGMDPSPGGKHIHAHRFRKTIGRLAGVALWNSPLVLKRLFGHKCIEMTLHYILCDPGVRAESEKILRELRVMHCASLLEELRSAHSEGRALPSHGGAGAARLMAAIRQEEEHLTQSGRVWNDKSAYDVAYLLTAQGQGWRLVKQNIICSKAPHEPGLCKKQAGGQPDTAGCKSDCSNRIVLERHRRDTEKIIEQYIDIAKMAHKEGQILLLSNAVDNLRQEIQSFPDLHKKYKHHEQHLLSLLSQSENQGLA